MLRERGGKLHSAEREGEREGGVEGGKKLQNENTAGPQIGYICVAKCSKYASFSE